MSRILLIDDSPSALQMTEMILVDDGHRVASCTDGDRAIQMLRTGSFDLIVTDIYMPDRDGLELIREARSICPAVPIIAISGKTGSWNMLGIANYLGACQTVQKPFSGSDLLRAVQRALSMARPHGAAPSCEGSVSGTPHPVGEGRRESNLGIGSHERRGTQE